MKNKYKVTFLLDKKNLWIENALRNYNFKLNSKYLFNITKNPKKIKNQDIVFPLSYTKKLDANFLKKNKLVLIPHPSKLPEGKGFAPLQYQILQNKKKFYISLIQAVNKIDSGPIFIQNSFKLKGDELSDQIRKIQGIQVLKIINEFLKKYPNVKSKNQKLNNNFNKRRYPKDSELDINMTIKQLFNKMRINDNNLYPSFFYYRKHKFILKIFKEKK